MSVPPLSREPVAVMWPDPEMPPESPTDRLDRLSAELRRVETHWYRCLHDNRRMVSQVVAYAELVKAIRSTLAAPLGRWHEVTGDLGRLADAHWARILEQAEVTRQIDARLHPPRDRGPTPAPPHDLAEFTWGECEVYRHPGAGSWRVRWRGGDVCVVGHLPSSGAFWDILTYPTKKAATADLTRRKEAECSGEMTLFDLALAAKEE